MAVDTAKKRKKAAGAGQDSAAVPTPDGTIDAGDRGMGGGAYLQDDGITVDIGDVRIQIIVSDRRRRRSTK